MRPNTPGMTAVWLMGVLGRSPAGTAIALADAGRMAEFRQVELAPWASHLFSIGPAELATAPQEEP